MAARGAHVANVHVASHEGGELASIAVEDTGLARRAADRETVARGREVDRAASKQASR